MGFSAEDILNSLERLVRIAAPAGLVLFVITGVLLLGFSFGLINMNAFGGYLWDGATSLFAVSIGLIGIGAVLLLFRGLVWIARAMVRARRSRKEERDERQRLSENINLLATESRLLLVHYMQHPSGRFTAPPENPAFDELWRLDVVKRDNVYAGVIYSGYSQGSPFRVNPVIFAAKNELLNPVVQSIAKHFSGDLTNPKVVRQHYEATLRQLLDRFM